MPILEKPPLDALASVKDRWTPIVLEHGRLEVDDASVKWIQDDGTIAGLPIATISVIALGPGTTITHAAVKACAQSNTPIVWVGSDTLHFYALGHTPTSDNTNAKRHALAWSNPSKRLLIAKKLFQARFPNVAVADKTINQLRGLEGFRIREKYKQFGLQFGVTWKGRDYSPSNFFLSDHINRALSAVHTSLYALVLSAVHCLGYLPQLGFIHEGGRLPFVYDIADLYKVETSIPAAFHAVSQNPMDNGKLARLLLKQYLEEHQVARRLPDDIQSLFVKESVK